LFLLAGAHTCNELAFFRPARKRGENGGPPSRRAPRPAGKPHSRGGIVRGAQKIRRRSTQYKTRKDSYPPPWKVRKKRADKNLVSPAVPRSPGEKLFRGNPLSRRRGKVPLLVRSKNFYLPTFGLDPAAPRAPLLGRLGPKKKRGRRDVGVFFGKKRAASNCIGLGGPVGTGGFLNAPSGCRGHRGVDSKGPGSPKKIQKPTSRVEKPLGGGGGIGGQLWRKSQKGEYKNSRGQSRERRGTAPTKKRAPLYEKTVGGGKGSTPPASLSWAAELSFGPPGSCGRFFELPGRAGIKLKDSCKKNEKQKKRPSVPPPPRTGGPRKKISSFRAIPRFPPAPPRKQWGVGRPLKGGRVPPKQRPSRFPPPRSRRVLWVGDSADPPRRNQRAPPPPFGAKRKTHDL